MRILTDVLPPEECALLTDRLAPLLAVGEALTLSIIDPSQQLPHPGAGLCCCVYRSPAQLSPAHLRPGMLYLRLPLVAGAIGELEEQLKREIERELAYRRSRARSTTPHVDFPCGTGRQLRIACSDLLYLEAHNSVTRAYYLEEGELQEVLVRLPLKEAVALLPEDCWYQLHRCYVVNPAHVVPPRFLRAREVALKSVDRKLPVARGRVRGLLAVL